jgi:ATP-dependent helicase/nuclease subunit A
VAEPDSGAATGPGSVPSPGPGEKPQGEASPARGREVILASAGSGKTYRLSSCLIGLLAMGVPPEEVLASTFTRKAAGEIVDRVLTRLADGALDPKAARELEASMPAWATGARLDPAGCAELLGRTTRRLHRLQVHTLDAFFHRVARTFALELGLPERWEPTEDADRDRLRLRAVDATLGSGDRSALHELVQLASRGGADRDVHRLLSEEVKALHLLYRELDPTVPDPWGFEGGATGFGEPGPEMVAAGILALGALEVPLTKKGAPRKRWASARDSAVRALAEGDWREVVKKGVASAVLQGKAEFAGAAIPEDWEAAHQALLRMARSAIGVDLQRRISAIGLFLARYDAEFERVSREEGRLDFPDMTLALARSQGLGRGDALFYRLDGRIRHVLLDEFQDTSTMQWAALAPLVGEILSGYRDERVAFIVADPKQSIYGWRGGEPRVLESILADYGIEPDTMARSWRSSQVVLDAVNRVFAGVVDGAVLTEDPEIREIARRWGGSFEPHRAARDLPGYVRLETGPVAGGRGRKGLEGLLRHAAEVTGRLHREAPGITIGVLTRTNAASNFLLAHLQRMGVEASDEGGVPVADSAPVVALLALLRMVDHPGDVVSRYLVAKTPAGDLVGFGPDDFRDLARAEAVGREVRSRLLRDGYGSVVSKWVGGWIPWLPARDRGRLRRLAELAHAWDARATLRPVDFVRAVEAARSEDPTTARVRVMSVHRAKGLEFDAVVLPELDGVGLGGGSREGAYPYRPGGVGPVTRVYPRVAGDHLPLFPEVQEAAEQAREREVRDALSAVYVALTRARHGLYLCVLPDPEGTSQARTGARLVRSAFGVGEACEPEEVLLEIGDPRWWTDSRVEVSGPEAPPPMERADDGAHALPIPLLAPAGPRRRLLPREAPSDLEGGERVPLGRILGLGGREARDRGTLVHVWLESIEWLDSGPDDEALLEIARSRTPGLEHPEARIGEFRRWLEAPAVRRLLTRESYPVGTRVATELPFLVRDGDRMVQGTVDRLLWIPDPGGERLLVVDWKTDALTPGDVGTLTDRTEFYRPQVDAYARAIARSEGVPRERVETALVFLSLGAVREARN